MKQCSCSSWNTVISPGDDLRSWGWRIRFLWDELMLLNFRGDYKVDRFLHSVCRGLWECRNSVWLRVNERRNVLHVDLDREKYQPRTFCFVEFVLLVKQWPESWYAPVRNSSFSVLVADALDFLDVVDVISKRTSNQAGYSLFTTLSNSRMWRASSNIVFREAFNSSKIGERRTCLGVGWPYSQKWWFSLWTPSWRDLSCSSRF